MLVLKSIFFVVVAGMMAKLGVVGLGAGFVFLVFYCVHKVVQPFPMLSRVVVSALILTVSWFVISPGLAIFIGLVVLAQVILSIRRRA